MATALRFLRQSHLPSGKLQQVQAAGSRLQQLQGTLQQATDIRQFIGEREQQLKTQLSGAGFTKQLLGINKESYYYQQQLAGYKDLLNNRDKLKEQVLSQLSRQRAFQDFMQQHSYLSRLSASRRHSLPDRNSPCRVTDKSTVAATDRPAYRGLDNRLRRRFSAICAAAIATGAATALPTAE